VSDDAPMTPRERITYVVAGALTIVVCVALITGTWEGLVSIIVAIAGILGTLFLPPRGSSIPAYPD